MPCQDAFNFSVAESFGRAPFHVFLGYFIELHADFQAKSGQSQSIEMAQRVWAAAHRQTGQNRRILQRMIHDITSTFIIRVSGHSMEGAGISDGDELIINRALERKDGSIVIAVIDGELTVKRLRLTARGVVLAAENSDYPDIQVPALSEFVCWGVAETCLHRHGTNGSGTISRKTGARLFPVAQR